MNRRSQSGVALVITLIMMAIVLVMAIIFLALTRRERGSVKATEDLAIAKNMSEAGIERAKAQALAQMAAYGSTLKYDLFVSTNFINPAGFTPQGGNINPDPYNVSYVDKNGKFLTGDDFLQNVRNLQFDARVPVFIPTNNSGASDFRFFLDFNRNRVFETNGFTPTIADNGSFVSTNGATTQNLLSAAFSPKVGDPEWYGVLQHPDRPHGEDNYFIGRVAFVALPAGKTLDLNHIHNHSNTNIADDLRAPNNGFLRNQGVGSWEMNLAAFLRELNTNNYAWHRRSYFYSPTNPAAPTIARGDAFDDARALLGFRYDNNRRTLLPASRYFNPPNEFLRDNIDNYGDGPLVYFTPLQETTRVADRDHIDLPYPGSPSTNSYYDVQQLFSMANYSAAFTGFSNRLAQASSPVHPSSYDRYTFYRALAQLGVDSDPAIRGKVHLNYENQPGTISTNLQPWTNAVQFFTLAADAMLKSSMITNVTPIFNRAGQFIEFYTNYTIAGTIVRPDISITNIQIWHQPPLTNTFATSNEYTAGIHRILQVALNIWDNMTNRYAELGDKYPFFPTVLQPVFRKTTTNLTVSGFIEATNAAIVVNNTWIDLDTFVTNATYSSGVYTNFNIYGHPVLIGAKKGHPNFNEFSVESVAQVTRKLQLGKAAPGNGPVIRTNEMFVVDISTVFGVEAWNSYSNNYPRNVRLSTDVQSFFALSNSVAGFTNGIRYGTNSAAVNIVVTNWTGTGTNGTTIAQSFEVPIRSLSPFLKDAVYVPTTPWFITNSGNNVSLFQALHDPPLLKLYTTNRLRYWVTDIATGRLIDLVSLDKQATVMDISRELMNQQGINAGTTTFGSTNSLNEAIFWYTNLVRVPYVTAGITNQLGVSLGTIPVSLGDWRDYVPSTPDTRTKNESIDIFRVFLGLPPLSRWSAQELANIQARAFADANHQAPFTPVRKIYQRFTWEANDPLVHYTAADLRKPVQAPALRVKPAETPTTSETGLGRINDRYRPWGNGGQKDVANNTNAYRMLIKDPGIERSDDWAFPITLTTNNFFRFANIGWLGRVHRGTPWQTIYLKSGSEDPRLWVNWAGSLGSHPTTDWNLLDAFTAAPSEAATSGLLSVNQTNLAAWSAVLSGVPVISNSVPNTKMAANTAKQFEPYFIEPGSPQILKIVTNLNFIRASIIKTNYSIIVTNGVTNVVPRLVQQGVFHHLGSVLAAPALTLDSPFLNITNQNQARYAFTDEVVERVPQQILSLLKIDEPKFVVYSFGQSLRPAPRSISTSGNFYGLCTNYQVTAEAVTKTTFHVEGDLQDPRNPLRAVIDEYKALPPPE